MSRPPAPSFVDDATVPAEAGGGATLERAPGQRLGVSADGPATGAEPRTEGAPETVDVEPETLAAARPRPTLGPDAGASPAPGSRVGRFTVLERLGAGGMGVVMAAYDPKLDRRVALKLLRGDVEPDPDGDGEARLLREAQAMARVSHPNVISVFEVGSFAGQVYVAMEYVAGVTLRQWLFTSRSPAEVITVFEQAGRGLAAAHAAGLVHRDFKPANVMLGDDGRVRVLDFGLARPTTGTTIHSVTEDDARAEVVLDAQITRTGVAMGTPAYMAPEQIEPEPALDAKSDQFAFCVALYEALCGQPPFAGQTLTARLEQIRDGAVREPPPDRKLPRAVRDALVRGLSARPSARFESMDALLAALRPRVSRRRPLVLGGVVAAVMAGLLAWGLSRGGEVGEPAPPCLDAAAPMQALWSPARQEQLAASFTATRAEFAAAAWAGVAPRVGAYVSRGAELRVAACEATHVHGTQSHELLDRRMACLDRGRRELGALLDVWARADADAVAAAAQAVGQLPALEPCDDLEALLQGVAPPADAALAERVDRARERLAALRAEERAGHYRQAHPRAEATLLELGGIPYPPLHAEAALVAGRLAFRRGRYGAARERLERAHDLALALRHDEVAVEAAGALVLMLGEHMGRIDEALLWWRQASALLEREHPRGARDPGAARRNLTRLRGLLHGQRGEIDQALALQQQSLREAEEALGPGDPETAMAHVNLAHALDAVGRPADARGHLERARTIFEAIGGPEHPDVAYALHGLADLEYDAGRLDEARALYQRAYEIRVQAGGTGSLLLAMNMSRLATVAAAQRRFDDAIGMATRSVELAEAELGRDNLQVGRMLNNLALAYVGAGQLAEAEAAHARMLAIFERQLPVDHPLLAAARSNLGTLRFQRGDYEGALAMLRRVLEVREQTLPPSHPKIAEALDKLGVVLVALERGREAVPLHERALVIHEASEGVEHLHTAETLAYLAEARLVSGDAAGAAADCRRLLALEGRFEAPEVMANGRFLLAQARWAQGEQAAARAEAAKARAAYAAMGFADGLSGVDEWLASR